MRQALFNTAGIIRSTSAADAEKAFRARNQEDGI